MIDVESKTVNFEGVIPADQTPKKKKIFFAGALIALQPIEEVYYVRIRKFRWNVLNQTWEYLLVHPLDTIYNGWWETEEYILKNERKI